MSASLNQMDSSESLDNTAAGFGPHDAGAVAFAALFGIMTITIAFATLRDRAWYMWTLIVAAALQSLGMIAFAYSNTHPTDHAIYMMSLSSLNLAPTFLAVATIMTYSRLLWWLTTGHSQALRVFWVPARFVSPACIALQVAVSALLVFGLVNFGLLHSSTPINGTTDAQIRLAHYQRGIMVTLVGYVVQLFTLSVFAVFSFALSSSRKALQSEVLSQHTRSCTKVMWSINVTTLLLWFQNIFKVAECAQLYAQDTSLSSSTTVFWACEILPIFVALAVQCFVFSGKYLPQEATRLVVRTKKPIPRQVMDTEAPPPSYDQVTSEKQLQRASEKLVSSDS